MSYADIQKLQSLRSVGTSQSSEGNAFILRNDLEAVWNRVQALKIEEGSRIDIVLDNCTSHPCFVLPVKEALPAPYSYVTNFDLIQRNK